METMGTQEKTYKIWGANIETTILDIKYSYGAFLYHGVPPVIIHFYGIFLYKPTILGYSPLNVSAGDGQHAGQVEEQKKAFDALDLDGNGKITLQEVKESSPLRWWKMMINDGLLWLL